MNARIALSAAALAGVALAAGAAPILIDHRDADVTRLTLEQIERAKASLHIAYGHTSHGSQLTEGMAGLVDFANGGGKGLALPENAFAWNQGGSDGALDLHDYALCNDVGYYPDWVVCTSNYLDDPAHTNVNVILWSWCGQMDDKYEAGTLTNEYLAPMAAFERNYPHVAFVYMTGHVDIWNDADNKAACAAIRAWCATNDRILYDFNDVEHTIRTAPATNSSTTTAASTTARAERKSATGPSPGRRATCRTSIGTIAVRRTASR